MRRPREVKEANHSAILAEASRLFRERGVRGDERGRRDGRGRLTHGGFYRHFEIRSLVAAAIRETFRG